MKFLKLFSSLLFSFLALCLNAEERPYARAREIAEDFFSSAVYTKSSTLDLELVWSGRHQTKAGSSAPALYVFNNASGPGFVIVSGDDAVRSILGYSFDNEFVVEDMPVNVRGWLYGMEDEILDAMQYDGRQQPLTKPELTSGVVLKQYTTALWDQTDPYNSMCPVINGQDSYTGCVATAMAIVMRHHKWPDAGEGSVPGYVTSTYNVPVSSVNLGQAYDWDNMPLTYTGTSTEAQKKAVARLMADCGAILKMDYGPIGSYGSAAFSEDVPLALSKYMKYDPSLMLYERGCYTEDEWNSMLRKELDENGPVLYRGQSSEGGHMFVLDAYTNKNYYGVNWGWSGYCNGFFTLSALVPEDYGSGGSAGGFTYFQAAVLGVCKDKGGEPLENIGFSFFSAADKKYAGISASVTEFSTGVPFDVSFGLTTNLSTVEYEGAFALAVVDKNDSVKEFLHQISVSALPPSYGYCFDWTVTITQPIKVGDHLIGMYYDNASSSWVKIRGNVEYGAVDTIQLTDGKTIASTTSFRYDSAERKIYLTVQEGVSVYVRNSSGADLSSVISAEGTSVTVDASDLTAGRYKLRLENDVDSKDLYFVLGEK